MKAIVRTLILPIIGSGYLLIASKVPDLPLSETSFTETVLYLIGLAIGGWVPKLKKKKSN